MNLARGGVDDGVVSTYAHMRLYWLRDVRTGRGDAVAEHLRDLTSDPRNARKHNPRNIGMIEAALRDVGAARSIVVDEDGVVLAGNATIEAAAAAGIERVITVDADGEAIIAVRRTGLTPEQKNKLALYDNRTAELADWDTDVLASLSDDVDLSGMFFDDELAELLAGIDPPATIGDPDAVPDPPADPITQPGDLWLMGEHRLLCGDATVVTDVDRLMAGRKADMVFTDPPYGIGIDGQKLSTNKNPKHNRKAHEFRGWDSVRTGADVFVFILAINVPTVIFGGNYFADMLPPSRGWVYWDKGQNGLTMSDGELAWSNLEKPLRAVVSNRANIGDSVHPTQKPINVVIFCLDYANVHGVVLDPFLGSGSTLIACEQTGRTCYGMEIDPKYVDVSVARWETFTGQQATREAVS